VRVLRQAPLNKENIPLLYITPPPLIEIIKKKRKITPEVGVLNEPIHKEKKSLLLFFCCG
jgi:hypothetical protein